MAVGFAVSLSFSGTVRNSRGRLRSCPLFQLIGMSLQAQVLLIHDGESPRHDILAALRARYDVITSGVVELGPVPPGHSLLVIDAQGRTYAQAKELRDALGRIPNRLIRRVFIIDEASRLSIIRATAFGAEAVVARPIMPEMLYPCLERLIFDAIWDKPTASGGPHAGLHAGVEAIENILQFASNGQNLTQEQLYDHGDSVIHCLSEIGLGDWIEAVKRHHCRTFRHSLLVTGVAVGFGQLLGFCHKDLQRLALGGLMHDVGKAQIPLKILEKPGPLTPAELLLMRDHAKFGRDLMKERDGFSPELVEVVAHHHELLDGSGYPDGLMGDSISDLVRAVTLADIFAALIEERAYKPRQTASDAYETMLRMQGKLDPALLREFSFIALRTSLGN
jgi:putative nucleotidyltransferase with HDIG domain